MTYRELEMTGPAGEVHHVDELTADDIAEPVRVQVTRLGAELVSIARRNVQGEWVGFLYRDGDLGAPASGWPYHATVMGPYTHRLKDGESRYGGERIAGGPHGFLRHTRFGPPTIVDDDGRVALEYTIGPGEYGPDDYPRHMRFTVRYTVVDAGVHVRLAVRNLEDARAVHASFGLHPGFSVGTLENACLELPVGDYVEHDIPGSLLSGETRRFRHEGGCLDLGRIRSGGSIILGPAGAWHGPVVLTSPETGHRVRLDVEHVPHLTVWTDGNPYLCVEPVWGLPDHHDQRPFEEKQAIRTIAAGRELARSFAMRFFFTP
jgi:galactose mutarotase-like enzyme